MHRTQALVVVNEYHNPIMIFVTYLTRVTIREGLDRGLGLNLSLTLVHTYVGISLGSGRLLSLKL